MPCDSTSWTGTQVANRSWPLALTKSWTGKQDPRRRNALMSRVLKAAPLMLSERSNIPTSTEKPTTSKADPPDQGPHHTQARRPQVSCDIGPQYGIISTLKIPAVSSGATWTLSLQNLHNTSPEYFCHPFIAYSNANILYLFGYRSIL